MTIGYDEMTSGSSTHVVSNDHRHPAGASLWVSINSVVPALATVNRRRSTVQCVVIASMASFGVGVVMTTASFGPLLYSPGQNSVVVIIFQVMLQTIILPILFTCQRKQ